MTFDYVERRVLGGLRTEIRFMGLPMSSVCVLRSSRKDPAFCVLMTCRFRNRLVESPPSQIVLLI
jgi:hypothetical protein